MSTETKWIVGTGIVAAILTTGVGLATLMISLIAGAIKYLPRKGKPTWLITK